MDSYKQYIKEALPNLSIHSYKQNEEGWDNVAVIVNDELLFRFPRKQEYAMRIPLEKELCTILTQSLQEIEVPQYHLIYTNESDEVPLCSYYTLIHGEPLKTEIVANLDEKERKIIITQLATFLAALHSIPLKSVTALGFPTEKTLTYWKELQTKLNEYVTNSLTSFQKSTLNRLFENFFACLATSKFQNTIIHADFTHHHILFDKQNKTISGIIDLVMLKLEILPLTLLGYMMISDMNLLHQYMNNTVHLLHTMIHYSLTVSQIFINTVLYYII